MLQAGERTTANAVGLFGWFFSCMRGGERARTYRIVGRYRGFRGEGGARDRTLFTTVPLWRVAQKRKARGTVRETSLFG